MSLSLVRRLVCKSSSAARRNFPACNPEAPTIPARSRRECAKRGSLLLGALRAGTAALLLALALSPAVSQASSLFFNFENVFSGTSPSSPHSPWVNALLEDVTPGTVRLTVSNLTLVGSENTDSLYLNLRTNLNPNNLTFSFTGGSGGFDTPTVSTGVDQFKADGDGKYDILFTFSTGGNQQNRFDAHEYMTVNISGIPTLNVSDFIYLSAPAGGVGPFYAATHVQRINGGSISGWISPNDVSWVSTVPEPSSEVLLGFAASLWLAWRISRRSKKGWPARLQLQPVPIAKDPTPPRDNPGR